MCKITILRAHNPRARNSIILNTWGYFRRSGERDGFGAAWVSKSGALGYVKSSSPELSRSSPPWCESFFEGKNLEKQSDGGWLLIHGRTATCGVSADNTHPMLDEHCTAALIHNGVVESRTFRNRTSSCDSELLLRAWDSDGAKSLAEISGYFAFAGLFRRRDGWHAVVARDDRARLRVGRLRSGADAWSTTDDGLAAIAATPLGDHKPMVAALFQASGPPELQSFSKATPAPAPDLAERWKLASKNYPSLFASESGEGAP